MRPEPPLARTGEPVDWTADGPVSPRFGDVYFSAEDGLEESRAVFLAGCGLPQAWAGRRRFTVAELGFGTGLNVLALLQLWARTRPSPRACLAIVSVEGFPLGPQDAARALGRWPELADLAAPLLERWPRGRRGLHRYDWPRLGATLDLIVDDVGPALAGWDGCADAWFLDGFAPSKNPAMWSEPVLAAVAAHAAPGARMATFTVAGDVRRGLVAQGLAVEKRPGFGRKKERLEVSAPGSAPLDGPAPRVAVIGAGIAGAALARALARQGCEPVVVDAAGAGAGASGNAAALVTPRLDAGDGPAARLHALAFARAAALYADETPGAVIASGALQLERTDRDAGRFARIGDSNAFDPLSLRPLSGGEIAAALDEAAAPAGLHLADACVVEPSAVLAAWLGEATVVRAPVVSLARTPQGGWRLQDEAGQVVAEAQAVVIAAGAQASGLLPSLSLRPVRGQASTAATPFTGFPAAWGGYAIPTRDGVLFGASHGPGDADDDLRPEEAQANLARLAEGRPALAARVADLPPARRGERAAVRATLRDHLPVAGAVPGSDGLYVLGGLGGRGFALAPLLAEHVAALVAGAPSPLSLDLQAAVSPARRGAQEPPSGGAVPPAPPRLRPSSAKAPPWPEPS